MDFPKRAFCFVFLTFLFSGCDGDSSKKRHTVFRQSITLPVAWLVIEWNGRPDVMASGFLVDKEKGVFVTAKHFTDALDDLFPDEVKVFFNGKVYSASLAGLAGLRDAALLKLEEPFDPADFPEPYRIADEPVSVGDTVFIQGFHSHPLWLSTANKNNGRPDRMVFVLDDYYHVVMLDPTKKINVVFDNLKAVVLRLDTKHQIGKPGSGQSYLNRIRNEVNTYTDVRTKHNHVISFGGLSGGAATNKDGELTGIITAEAPQRFEFDPKGRLLTPRGFLIRGKLVRDEISVTPIAEIKDLLRRIHEW